MKPSASNSGSSTVADDLGAPRVAGTCSLSSSSSARISFQRALVALEQLLEALLPPCASRRAPSANHEDLELGQPVEPQLEDGVDLLLVELEALRSASAAASCLPSDARMMRMVSSSASKTFAKPSRMWMRSRSSLRGRCSRRLLHDLHAEVEEVPEHLRADRAAPGAATSGFVGRDEAGHVDADVRRERRVLVQVRHHQLRVGALLDLEHDARLVGALVAHVEQRRQLLGDDHLGDLLDDDVARSTAYGIE